MARITLEGSPTDSAAELICLLRHVLDIVIESTETHQVPGMSHTEFDLSGETKAVTNAFLRVVNNRYVHSGVQIERMHSKRMHSSAALVRTMHNYVVKYGISDRNIEKRTTCVERNDPQDKKIRIRVPEISDGRLVPDLSPHTAMYISARSTKRLLQFAKLLAAELRK